MFLSPLLVLFVIGFLALSGLKVLQEYERGVVFRLGRMVGTRGPGLVYVFPGIERLVKISLRIVTTDVPPQDVVTRDNVSIIVNAVILFRVVDPIKCVINVESYLESTFQYAQTTLRSVLGSAELDETFRARLDIADKITPAQMHAVNAAMERAVGETALKLESQMILLATAVSGAPFLGLLGTVWGVMDTFTGVAEAGSANLAAMAPGVSGALITTVTALCVAIPAMFGYNFLVTSIRGMVVEMDNFAAELASEFEHNYVEHGARVSDFRS